MGLRLGLHLSLARILPKSGARIMPLSSVAHNSVPVFACDERAKVRQSKEEAELGNKRGEVPCTEPLRRDIVGICQCGLATTHGTCHCIRLWAGREGGLGGRVRGIERGVFRKGNLHDCGPPRSVSRERPACKAKTNPSPSSNH